MVINRTFHVIGRMDWIAWWFFILAALMEVVGDAVIRRGLVTRKIGLLVAGCAVLAGYGLVVNSVQWKFSKLLGVYVGFFALISTLTGWIVFQETIPRSTWLGLVLIILGCMVIQFGQR